MEETLENYENYKKNLSVKLGANGRGKLTPHKKLIGKMIEDGLMQKDMRAFLKEEFNLEISQNNFSAYIKKLKSNKIVKMELINGTNFVAAPLVQIKEKKSKPKNIVAFENATNKITSKIPLKKSEENIKNTDSSEQKISSKVLLNLPDRKIETGELKKADRSGLK